ncbi:MAG: hydroxymethylglutaryl-CoA reductase, degradative [Spirochaetales bacterium]|nr:hydroxymethylglutaryl-CoA reductase, degradative [Spirochaetales bacterium]
MLTEQGGWTGDFVQDSFLELSDVMTENAVGAFAVPLGILPEIIVNGKSYTVPLATEEASVIAASGYAAVIVGRHGGFIASSSPPVMTGQIFLRNAGKKELMLAKRLDKEIAILIAPDLAGMKKRGGGLEGIAHTLIAEKGILKTELYINVCDAMGANLINSVCEKAGKYLEEKTACPLLMAILSNAAERRMCQASFELPVSALPAKKKPATEIAEAIAIASELAGIDPERAVTHNKGIMNGIHALALATGNDTRALESAVHYHASLGGRYRGLSRYYMQNGILLAELEIPLALALKGGATEFHPAASANAGLMDLKDAGEFSRLAASVGLAQNFAALLALVSGGIQPGHMALHDRKKSFRSGPGPAGPSQ